MRTLKIEIISCIANHNLKNKYYQKKSTINLMIMDSLSFKNINQLFPKIIGKPPSPDPITITFEFGDSDSFKDASIPFS